MSVPWAPPRRSYHLRVFVVCLLIVVIGLVGFLFGVRLEAIVPASGFIAARGQEEIRAGIGGLIELGWHEGELTTADGSLRFRLDAEGNGMTDPGQGTPREIKLYQLSGSLRVDSAKLKFHKLEAGDELWPAQALAWVRVPELQAELRRLQARREDLGKRGEPDREIAAQIQALKEQLARAVLRLPDRQEHWLALKVLAEPLQAVEPGAAVALVAPLDPATRKPKELIAFLEILEKHSGEITPGQSVRLYSTMHNQRLFGHAEARIERLEPLGESLPGGERRFRAMAAVSDAPFELRPGSSFKAEIIIGRKQVYRIILEQ